MAIGPGGRRVDDQAELVEKHLQELADFLRPALQLLEKLQGLLYLPAALRLLVRHVFPPRSPGQRRWSSDP